MLLDTIILLFTAFVYVNAEVIVTIPDGVIQGRIEYSRRNISFYAFQEIPFAKPPVGDLRFQAPQPAERWEGVLNATKNTKICYQQNNIYNLNLTLLENEDCLYLNVYAPRYTTAEDSLPVMFFFYGGGFIDGTSIFDVFGPHYFMEHGVIVVTANYRVGPFGFLATGDLVIPGNNGLKDQLLALKWINQNIEYFGGDPQKVTIFGQSAGGASVNFHYMSKKSEGLFRAGIAQSGSVLSPWAYQANPKNLAYKLASYVDSSFQLSSSSEELLRFLKSVPAEDIKKAGASAAQLISDQIVQGYAFTPTVEPEHENAFITEMMYEAVEKGHMNRVPMMMGICSEEMILRASDLNNFALWQARPLDINATLLVNDNMHLTDPKQLEAAGEAIHKIYTDGAFADNLGKAVRYYSDTSFNRGIIRYADMQSKFSDIYFYQFSYHGDLIGERPNIEGAYRVNHGDDLSFYWSWGNWSTMDSQTPRDILTFTRYITLMTNFAKYLDPTPESSSLFDNIDWPTVTSDNFQYLDINDTVTVKRNPKGETYPKWVEVYEQMAIKPYTTF